MKLAFLVADEVRIEASGKQTVIGLYADNVLLVHTKDKPAGTPETAAPAIERIAFLVNVSDVPEGNYVFKGQIFSPSGTALGPRVEMGNVNLLAGRSQTLVFQVKPLVLNEGGGEYTFAIWVNEEERRFTIEVRIAD